MKLNEVTARKCRYKWKTILEEMLSQGVMDAIWVTEQFDGAGILYSCIACCDEVQAKECYASFEAKLTPEQREQGWVTQQRQVTSWDDVPVSALKLSR